MNVVDALDLLPKQIAAMMAVGATPEVVEAACAVICQAAKALIGIPDAIEQRRQSDRARQQKHRSASRDRHVTPPLSLKEEDLFSREREEEKGCGEEKPTPETPAPIPDEWKPDDRSWRLAIDKLGEGAALRCLANYRDHCAVNAKPMTEAQRQAKFRIWVRNERSRAVEPQPQLPLMAIVSTAPAGKARLSPQASSAQWEAWARHRGKSLPIDKAGGWWVDSEWPPGYELRRESG